MVLWNYKDWVGWNGIPDQSMTPFGQCQTLSKMSTISNIKNAQEIILNTDIEKYVKHRFQRISEPNPIGFGADSYIVVMWKRIG
jgi:aminopeptidase C